VTQLMHLQILLVGKHIQYVTQNLLLIFLHVDARFEVLGAPYSLLSVSLSASQKLYTRRGTLVGVSGKAENVSLPNEKGACKNTDYQVRPNQHYQSLSQFEEPRSESLSSTKRSPLQAR
jgi:hypothetical protein